MRVLVTGAAGMLGTALVPIWREAGHSVSATDLVDVLDVRDPVHNTSTEGYRPDLVVNLAALTDLEECEAHPFAAYATNHLGAGNIAHDCERAGIPLVHVSTAGVFAGDKADPYTEADEPNPVNVYGRSKLLAEQTVAATHPHSWIVRAGWMVAGNPQEHKFVRYILDQLQAGAKRIYAVDDRFGTPTYAPDFSRCLLGLVEKSPYGLYHMAASSDVASRYDVAVEIVRLVGADGVVVEGVSSERFKDRFWAPRPVNEAMENAELDRLGLNTMRPWREALAEYLGPKVAA